MISLVLLVIAAILNALMDTLNDHFSSSIFSKKDPKIWNHQISWQFAKTVLGYHIDPWHIAKSIMVLLVILAILAYKYVGTLTIMFYVDFAVYSVAWNLVFNLFYNKIFKKN